MGTASRHVKRARAAAAAVALSCAAPAAASPGVMVDAGAPDGATASITWRPAAFARLHAGLGHNAISPGVRAGITFLPLRLPVTPVVSIDAGKYAEGDAGPLARRLSGDPQLDHASLERVGYEYASARGGLEFDVGPSRVFLHAGVSFMRGDLRGAQEFMNDDTKDGEGPRIEIRDDPEIRAIVPSARAGFLIDF